MAVTAKTIQERVRVALQRAPIHDIHTHLFAPEFGERLLTGIDELLTYHYLLAELFRVEGPRLDPKDFYAQSKEAQAEQVWRRLFLERSPLSEACRGVLTCLQAYGLKPQSPLKDLRAFFDGLSPKQRVDRVLEISKVETVVMTNDPFDPIELPLWTNDFQYDSRFLPVLRLDPLFDWQSATAQKLQALGYNATEAWSDQSARAVQRFLDDWIERMEPLYVAASVAPEFHYPNAFMEQALLPALARHKRPLALMIGVRRQVNPGLQLAGDGLGLADLSSLARLCAAHPKQKVLCTVLARENQHELAILARKFPNLHVFGCWWFVNIPELTEEITRMRLELLGHTFTPQHSDARVFDQLIYKWQETRKLLQPILTQKYQALEDTGWTVTDSQMQTEINDFLGASALRFLRSDS